MTDGPADNQPRPPRAPVAAGFDLADPAALLSPSQAAEIRRLVHRALSHLQVSGEVRALVVNDAAMSEAHQRYSGISGTTDVLTFDLSGSGHPPLDTDLYICFDEARRQAARRNHTIELELALYTIHGVLHCLGFDDHDEHDYQLMHRTEDEVLAAIGAGPVFHRPESSRPAETAR